MNQEEFKLNLVRQSKISRSDLLYMLIEPNRDLWNGSNIYKQSEIFYSSEHKLRIHLFSHYLDGEDTKISMHFEPVQDNSVDWKAVKNIDIGNPEFMKKQFVFETISFQPNEIVFTIRYESFGFEDGTFYRNSRGATQITHYNFKREEFVGVHPFAIKHYINAKRSFDKDFIYIDAVADRKMIQDYQKNVANYGLLSVEQQSLLGAIMALNPSSDKSTITQLIQYLETQK